jgi:tetratricopeptide (TPR) repeat protein
LFILAHYSLGQAYMNLRRFPRAIVAFEHCVNATRALHGLQQGHRVPVEPFYPPAEVLLALGSAFFRNEQEHDAEVQWKAAAEVKPGLGEAHNNLAIVYIRTGRLDAAARELALAEKSGFRVNPQLKQDLKNEMEHR